MTFDEERRIDELLDRPIGIIVPFDMTDENKRFVFLGDCEKFVCLRQRLGDGFFNKYGDLVLQEELSDLEMSYRGGGDAYAVNLTGKLPVILGLGVVLVGSKLACVRIYKVYFLYPLGLLIDT